jgi:hypothetical protein
VLELAPALEVVAAEPEPPVVAAPDPGDQIDHQKARLDAGLGADVIEQPGASVAPARIWIDDQDDDESEHTEIGSLQADPSSFEETVVLPGDAVAVLGAPVAVPVVADAALATSPGDEDAPEPEDEDEDIEEIEEIEEFEILAEADAADADLLAAHGEAELAAAEIAPLTLDPRDDADAAGELDDPYASARAGSPYARHGSRGDHAAAAPRSRNLENEFDSHHAGFASPDRFDQSDVLTVPPELRHDRRSALPRARTPAPDRELEAALGVLDADLDGPSVKHAPVRQTGASRVVRPATGAPSGRAPRASTEDGILINFDDDDD